MDEFTLFAELRPDDTLSDAELRDLRAELFPTSPPAASVIGDELLLREPLGVGNSEETPTRARSRSLLAVAAALIIAVGVAGIWSAADRRTPIQAGTPDVPSQSTPAPSAPIEPTTAGPYDAPLIGFDEPGWTLTSGSDANYHDRRTVLMLSDAGFDGPWVEVVVRPFNTQPQGDTTVDINGSTARVNQYPDGMTMTWDGPDGTTIEARGWQTSLDELASIARAVTVTADAVSVTELPAGATLAEPAAVHALGQATEYQFTNTDGRQLQVTFQPGAARGLYERQGPPIEADPEGRTPITIDGQPATIVHWDDSTEGAGSYRIDIQRGFWTYEYNTAGFSDEQQVIDLVAGTTTIDRGTWNSNLAGDIVAPDQRQATAEALLAGIDLPSGVDITRFAGSASESRYQFIAEVSGTLLCSWIDEWQTAQAAGDTTREQLAANAIASSHDWTMLHEIVGQGAWPQVLWSHADSLTTNTDFCSQIG